MLHGHIATTDAFRETFRLCVKVSIRHGVQDRHLPPVPGPLAVGFGHRFKLIDVTESRRCERLSLSAFHHPTRYHRIEFSAFFKLGAFHGNQHIFSQALIVQQETKMLMGFFDISSFAIDHHVSVVFIPASLGHRVARFEDIQWRTRTRAPWSPLNKAPLISTRNNF